MVNMFTGTDIELCLIALERGWRDYQGGNAEREQMGRVAVAADWLMRVGDSHLEQVGFRPREVNCPLRCWRGPPPACADSSPAVHHPPLLRASDVPLLVLNVPDPFGDLGQPRAVADPRACHIA